MFEVCIQVQAGRIYHNHERHQWLSRKRRGVENPCTFLMGKISQAALKVIEWWNCVHKSVLFLLIWTCASSYCHQIAVLFYWTLGHKWQLDKKTVPSSQSHCLMLKMWTQVTEERMVNQLQGHFMQKLQPRTFSDFQSQTRMPLFAIVDILHSLWTQIPS